MATWFTQSDALGVVMTLFWGSVLMSLACFLTDSYLHALLRTHWKPLLVGIVLVLIWRIPPEGGFFHGQEYEDSYVYTVAGRQMAEHFRIEPSGTKLPYSIDVCAVGSLNSCGQADNYPEHLIGYPYILSVLFKVFGYHSSIGSIANVVCACFVDILVFLICIVISDDVIVAGSAALIFAITPVFAVWGLETSAEPVSNAWMALVLWFCLRYVFALPASSSRWNTFVTWCAFTLTLLYSLTVKRENILLVVALPAIVFFVQFTQKRPDCPSLRRPLWALLGASLALVFSLQIKVFQTMSGESALLSRFPLTPSELIRLLPIFLRSFFIVQWYGGAVILVLIGAIIAWRRKSLGLFPLLLFAAYVLLYAFHIRSYYEMQSGSTDSRTALRFSMNLMCMWSILAGLGMAPLWGWLRRTRVWRNHEIPVKWIAICALAAVLGDSYYATKCLRDDVVEDEFRMRIEPPLTAVRAAASVGAKEDYILTLEPLIPQMYADPSVNVISLDDLNGAVMKEIGFLDGVTGLLYVDEEIHRTPADADRYKDQLGYLSRFQGKTLVSGSVFSVARINREATGHSSAQGH
jgi:hypothetical protein